MFKTTNKFTKPLITATGENQGVQSAFAKPMIVDPARYSHNVDSTGAGIKWLDGQFYVTAKESRKAAQTKDTNQFEGMTTTEKLKWWFFGIKPGDEKKPKKQDNPDDQGKASPDVSFSLMPLIIGGVAAFFLLK